MRMLLLLSLLLLLLLLLELCKLFLQLLLFLSAVLPCCSRVGSSRQKHPRLGPPYGRGAWALTLGAALWLRQR